MTPELVVAAILVVLMVLALIPLGISVTRIARDTRRMKVEMDLRYGGPAWRKS